MKDLASIQTAFQNAIVAGDDGVLAEILDGARETRGILVDIYRKAYLLRLLEAVRGRNRILAAHLGDAAFDALARAYIDTVPSRHPSLRRFCHDLPAFLERSAPYRDRPVIADLARIAEALAEAFEAPDHAVLAPSDLAIALTGTPTDFVVMPHPSARRLTLLSNAAAIWLALEKRKPSAIGVAMFRAAIADRLAAACDGNISPALPRRGDDMGRGQRGDVCPHATRDVDGARLLFRHRLPQHMGRGGPVGRPCREIACVLREYSSRPQSGRKGRPQRRAPKSGVGRSRAAESARRKPITW